MPSLVVSHAHGEGEVGRALEAQWAVALRNYRGHWRRGSRVTGRPPGEARGPEVQLTGRGSDVIFREAPLQGVYLIELEERRDERGFFARLFCEHELARYGLASRFVQVSESFSASRGTLRGLHYQLPPRAETKMVRCVKGALHDVVLDLRVGSSTFGRSFGAELSEENRLMMYVPKGFAHGLVTLTDDVEALYLVDEFYSPELERGIRWNDPAFGVVWPILPVVMSDKDRCHRDFDPAWHLPS